MTFEALKEKSQSLPQAPGVYIMRDRNDKVIYVGKAKKLKNRVSQYFHATASHSPKTRLMVSKIHQFDVIIAASEFEALVLECSLIKRHKPKYNILLKDDKGYPYIRLDINKAYPTMRLVSRPENDGAEYFGPFGGRNMTHEAMNAIRLALKLPGCSKRFPEDVGKGRPCLNFHMKQCAGWCCADRTQEEYKLVMNQVRQLLSGNYRTLAEQIKSEMLNASEAMNFERAAELRDRLRAVESLGQKQLVAAGSGGDTDVIGYGQTGTKGCFAVLHYAGGNLIDKEYWLIPVPDDPADAASSLVKQYYLNCGIVPKTLLMPFKMEDAQLIPDLIQQQRNRKMRIIVPQRGEKAALVDLACKNALEEAERVSDKEDKIAGALAALSKMLAVDDPKRIHSFDVSNISGTDIVASMVVFVDGKPKKSDYKRFKIHDLEDQDDYASMAQAVTRAFTHYCAGDDGFVEKPDILLIDGGEKHARTAVDALKRLGLTLPVFGMVKDNRHRTRALVTCDGREIAIDSNPAVFSLIGNIQEEVHRFAIGYHRKLRSKRLKYSQLDQIPGIGPKRKAQLLKTFGSIQSISQASISDLHQHLPMDAANAVYEHFHKEGR